MADVKAIAEELVNLTVKEVSELKTILKDEYGIEPAAAAVAVAAAPGAGAGAGVLSVFPDESMGVFRPVAPGGELRRTVWPDLAGRNHQRLLVSAAVSGPPADPAAVAEDGFRHGKAGL